MGRAQGGRGVGLGQAVETRAHAQAGRGGLGTVHIRGAARGLLGTGGPRRTKVPRAAVSHARHGARHVAVPATGAGEAHTLHAVPPRLTRSGVEVQPPRGGCGVGAVGGGDWRRDPRGTVERGGRAGHARVQHTCPTWAKESFQARGGAGGGAAPLSAVLSRGALHANGGLAVLSRRTLLRRRPKLHTGHFGG